MHSVNQPPSAHTFRAPRLARNLFPANLPRRTAVFLFLICAAFLARPCGATPGQWDYTGSLKTARRSHGATLLLDGRVLVAGGISGSGYLASAELYDPATATWSLTGSMSIDRVYPTVTLLPDGRVLVAGGFSSSSGRLASAELYDPASGTWSLTGNLNTARSNHSAILLPDGKVLVAGGLDRNVNSLKSAEIYDPGTGNWTNTGSFRRQHIPGLSSVPLTLIPNGKVLIEGGLGEHFESSANAELYDPASATWTLTGSLITGREEHTATLLLDGKVLVATGFNRDLGEIPSAELYDPASETWSETGSLLQERERHAATLLANGMVLVAGGFTYSDDFTTEAELYDPASGTWSVTGSLNTARGSYTATLLPNGMVLAAAGGDLSSAELYDPGVAVNATEASGKGSIGGQGDQATFNFHATLSGDRPSGSITFNDPSAIVAIRKAKVRTLTFSGNTAALGGNARLGDGTKVTYSVSVTDNGDGSTDTFNISLSNGYSAGGTLTSGDISIQ